MLTIETRNVSYRYNDIEALNGVSLSLKEGDIVGLIGPNGAGKSSLLKTIAGLLVPAGGVALVDGRDISKIEIKERARLLSALFQENSYGFDFTCEEIVLMGRYPHASAFLRENDDDREVVRRVMELTDTWRLRGRGIMEISGGERQRVTLARAFAQEPRILLLDEPTSNLDINYQQEILAIVRRMATEKGVVVIAVFHDLNLASIFSDSLVMLHNGKVFAAGAPSAVLTAEHIKAVYNAEIVRIDHPQRGVPVIILR